MASSDRGFRALAQESPGSVIGLVRLGAPGALAGGAEVTPAEVDDPHVGALTPVMDADWVARVGEREVLHVECQGYRDTGFAERLLRVHLHLALRYWGRAVHTVAIWLVRPPAPQRSRHLSVGTSIVVRAEHVVVPELPARELLAQAETACFAAGADAGEWSDAELCARVAEALAQGRASWASKHMAVIGAALHGRYDLMVSAMESRGMQPIVIEDLVKFGEDRGEARGVAIGRRAGREEGREEGALLASRRAVLDALEARGFGPTDEVRARVLAEVSVERLRGWYRRAITAPSLAAVFEADAG